VKEGFPKRLVAARERLGLTQEAFSAKCGIPLSTIKKHEGSHSEPRPDALSGYASTGINLHWLLDEEGEVLRHAQQSSLRVASDQPASHRARKLAVELPRGSSLNADDLAGDDFVMVPRYDLAGSAGGGALIHSEQIVDHLAFRADWVRNALGVARKDLVLISVKGDSMEPTLSDGDLILIDTSVRTIGDSAVYALRKGDELFVKRIQHKLDGTLRVMSDNAKYETETYDAEHAPAVIVIGRVLWVGRKL